MADTPEPVISEADWRTDTTARLARLERLIAELMAMLERVAGRQR